MFYNLFHFQTWCSAITAQSRFICIATYPDYTASREENGNAVNAWLRNTQEDNDAVNVWIVFGHIVGSAFHARVSYSLEVMGIMAEHANSGSASSCALLLLK